ncbi:DUF6480 family protein [Streptomyces sp. NPDC050255]|uniref:DUF6480 family protein n=1 Tax=Streptomyces sp. NPDC050255 TaxID=3365606 RepID=UPI00378E5FC7
MVRTPPRQGLGLQVPHPGTDSQLPGAAKSSRAAGAAGWGEGGGMAMSLTPPGETPPAEGSISEVHRQPADGGIWEHPRLWAGLILLGSIFFAAYFIGRIFGYG